jgi:tol-pal system protein YbgF
MKDTVCQSSQHCLRQQARCPRSVFANPALVSVTVFIAALAGGAPMVQAREPAPVIEATSQTTPGNLEKRLEIVEKRLDSQATMEMLTRMDKMQQEMQNLVGQMEVLNHDINNIKKRQRELYVDIDRRITQVEQKTAELAKSQATATPQPTTGTASAASTPPSPGGAQAGSATVASVSSQSSQLQRDAYDQAFNLLKNRRYDLAIASFKAYLETYPTAEYADNAQYWLGEANYAQRHYEVALREFNKVLDKYPKSSKRSDAMLKMGFSYQELGRPDDAKKVFKSIVSMFPDTTAARLAQKRLRDFHH